MYPDVKKSKVKHACYLKWQLDNESLLPVATLTFHLSVKIKK